MFMHRGRAQQWKSIDGAGRTNLSSGASGVKEAVALLTETLQSPEISSSPGSLLPAPQQRVTSKSTDFCLGPV